MTARTKWSLMLVVPVLTVGALPGPSEGQSLTERVLPFFESILIGAAVLR